MAQPESGHDQGPHRFAADAQIGLRPQAASGVRGVVPRETQLILRAGKVALFAAGPQDQCSWMMTPRMFLPSFMSWYAWFTWSSVYLRVTSSSSLRSPDLYRPSSIGMS